MKKRSTYTALALVGLMNWLTPCPVAANQKTYETGFNSISRISTDLYKALDSKKRGRLLPVPILLEKYPTPYLQPSTYSDGTNTWQAVYVSTGLVNFLNTLAHAKALEGTDRSAYSQYLANLRTANSSLPELQPVANSWSFDTMNHQVSHFNQMAGALVAVEMAHHYLGHYKKYEAKLKDAQGNPVSLNSVITPQEWHDAVIKGAKNALACGLGADGLKLVLETLENKETRPTWSIYFVPPQANITKAKRELTRLEKDFFMIEK